MQIKQIFLSTIFQTSLAAWALTSCATESAQSPTATSAALSSGEQSGGSGAGEPGARCDNDGDCGDPLACVGTLLNPNDKFCGAPCTAIEDCESLAATDYAIVVPLQAWDGHNTWNTEVLRRGVTCEASDESKDSPGYCRFVCPEGSAMTFDENGDLKGCNCLPHFSRAGGLDEPLLCTYDESIECAIIIKNGTPANQCDACNSDPIIEGCSTGRFMCLMNNSFEGYCVEWVDDPSACGSEGTWDCDPDCGVSCGASPKCLDICCTKVSGNPPDTSQCAGSGSDTGGPDPTGEPDPSGTTTTSGGNTTGTPDPGYPNCTDPEYPLACPGQHGLMGNCWPGSISCDTTVPCGNSGLACAEGYAVNCNDAVCVPVLPWAESSNARCSNGIDDDGDMLADCSDLFCYGNPSVIVCKGESTDYECANGVDDDGDGYTDCQDVACQMSPAVTLCGPQEWSGAGCSNGGDDDDDGDVDCQDAICMSNPFTDVCL